MADAAPGDLPGVVTAGGCGPGPVLAAVAAEQERADGFEAVLSSWRHGNVAAALQFLDEIG